jgi:DNA polymerase
MSSTLENKINACQLCELSKTRDKAVPGEGPRGASIMFIGEAPGEVNNQTGRPFVGHGGKIFDGILRELGIDRESVFITNTIKCWPPNNRKPKSFELKQCNIYLQEQLQLVKPKLIITLGAVAYKIITGESIKIKSEHGSLKNMDSFHVCPTFHPNGIRYVKGGRKTIIEDIKKALEQTKIKACSDGSNNNSPIQGKLF